MEVDISGDSWNVTIAPWQNPSAPLLLSPATCAWVNTTKNSTYLSNIWHCDPRGVPREPNLYYIVEVGYMLVPDTVFVTKHINIGSSFPYSDVNGAFVVQEVIPWPGVEFTAGSAPSEWQLAANPFSKSGDIAGFMRFPTLGRGLFFTVANPFTQLVSDDGSSACEIGLNHVGDDLPGMPLAISERDCYLKCANNTACVGYVFLDDGCETHTNPACFLKSKINPEPEGCSCLLAKPFPPYPSSHARQLTASYMANMNQTSQSTSRMHKTDTAIVGFTTLSKYAYPETGIYQSERLAFVKCVEHFLMDKEARANSTVKVNVAWDENDYQVSSLNGYQ